ncbi:chaperone protein dnaJ C76, chloroplastic [Euphorbia lathyris]|uniref:chaperone protein dnaJ C76, chloroplastic n=1 Tax=Euphorbia lathyris TaxID=212925 RepID=UPI0033141B4D
MGGATATATATLVPCSSITIGKDFLIPKSRSTVSFPSKSAGKFICRAGRGGGGGGGGGVTDLDLYEILGVDSGCDQSQIKAAYRTLQKRCHPDIAGAAGHDMAIILNQVYSILSDPISRFAYDKEQAKTGQLRGYTGKPIYSRWLGSESEERAVFVDEVKCVGCLKCALLADKTFAIESVYGRARVVAQWADPPHLIQSAIQACPVDCISMVERSDLAALEFLMSKQPRGNVRVGATNTAGQRVSNIFVDVKKFQATFNNNSKEETDFQLLSAILAIKSISNWLYWQSPNASESCQRNLLLIAEKSTQPNINKLREAAAARKQDRQPTRPSNYIHHEEYWTPLAGGALPASVNTVNSGKTAAPKSRIDTTTQHKQIRTGRWEIPMIPGILAAVIVNVQIRQEALGKLEQHVGGSFALEVVNSSWLPAVLAGLTWYIICMSLMQLAQAIQKRF